MDSVAPFCTSRLPWNSPRDQLPPPVSVVSPLPPSVPPEKASAVTADAPLRAKLPPASVSAPTVRLPVPATLPPLMFNVEMPDDGPFSVSVPLPRSNWLTDVAPRVVKLPPVCVTCPPRKLPDIATVALPAISRLAMAAAVVAVKRAASCTRTVKVLSAIAGARVELTTIAESMNSMRPPPSNCPVLSSA